MRRRERLAVTARDWGHAGLRQAAALVRRGGPGDFLEAGEGSCGRVPVVLLPGIWETWRFLQPLAAALHASGHPVHVVPGLGVNGRPLQESAGTVVAHLAAAHVRGAVLVAHSKGGLVGKLVLMSPDAAGRAVGLVAVCTPFGGSSLARPLLARPLVARGPLSLFVPTGSVLAALTAERVVNAHIVSLSSAWDEMIPEGSALAGAHNVTLDVAGHFRPVADAGVHRVVHEHVHRLAAQAEGERWS